MTGGAGDTFNIEHSTLNIQHSLLTLRLALAAWLLFALSCATARTTPPQQEWARGAVFYEIFVRSFADSNGDGIGDFNGLTSKLDYLTGLGVDGIWLMPVFESSSYHGYDTLDYERIEQDYGTNADFQRFLVLVALIQEGRIGGLPEGLGFEAEVFFKHRTSNVECSMLNVQC